MMVDRNRKLMELQKDTTGVFLTCGRLGFEDCTGGMALVLGFRLADIGWSPEAVASLATLQLPICEILAPIFILLQLPNFTWRKTHGLFAYFVHLDFVRLLEVQQYLEHLGTVGRFFEATK